MERITAELVNLISGQLRAQLPPDATEIAKPEFDRKLRSAFAAISHQALQNYILEHFDTYSTGIWEKFKEEVQAKKQKQQQKFNLFEDKTFEVEVERVESGAKPAALFSTLLLAPKAPASVRASFLNLSLNHPQNSLTASSYVRTLSLLPSYGNFAAQELVENIHQFISDLRTRPGLITHSQHINNFISHIFFRWQAVPLDQKSTVSEERFFEAVAELFQQELTLLAAEYRDGAASDHDDDDENDDKKQEDEEEEEEEEENMEARLLAFAQRVRFVLAHPSISSYPNTPASVPRFTFLLDWMVSLVETDQNEAAIPSIVLAKVFSPLFAYLMAPSKASQLAPLSEQDMSSPFAHPVDFLKLMHLCRCMTAPSRVDRKLSLIVDQYRLTLHKLLIPDAFHEWLHAAHVRDVAGFLDHQRVPQEEVDAFLQELDHLGDEEDVDFAAGDDEEEEDSEEDEEEEEGDEEGEDVAEGEEDGQEEEEEEEDDEDEEEVGMQGEEDDESTDEEVPPPVVVEQKKLPKGKQAKVEKTEQKAEKKEEKKAEKKEEKKAEKKEEKKAEKKEEKKAEKKEEKKTEKQEEKQSGKGKKDQKGKKDIKENKKDVMELTEAEPAPIEIKADRKSRLRDLIWS
eukprot:TRINITY_DN8958_c0_g2_i1.p1 TRINITY_DN8958_c0_g2~~TRINITY_DN8958_c0_g2_i1.p1  ORF type:complete len:628 (+),score=210.84 TRINITY_DN8958_c0_g2_i1:135-2018(+)